MRKILYLIIYILIWIILYSIPRSYFHVAGNSNLYPVLFFILIILILPLILSEALLKFKVTENLSTKISLASIALIIPFTLIVMNEDDNELEKYGKETKGVIYKAWFNRTAKRGEHWSVQAKYIVDEKIYRTSTKRDKHRILKKGDTVIIIYSSKTPQMNEIKELLESNNK